MEFHVSRLKSAGLVLLSSVFVAGGIMAAQADATRTRLVGWACVVLFGLCAVLFLWRLYRCGLQAMVVINEEGILDRRNKRGLVRWDDIVRVWVGQVFSSEFLCVEEHPGSASGESLVGRSNRLLGFPAITISFGELSPGLKVAMAHIQAIRPDKINSGRPAIPPARRS